MDKQAKAVLASVALALAVMVGINVFLYKHEESTFERNERIIADAMAAREARMTPAERQARDERVAAEAEAEAEASARAFNAAASERYLSSARGACLITLKGSLHDPGSAEFGRTSDWVSNVAADGRVHVMARIRAKNGFGAMRLATYICVVERVGGDRMKVVKLDQID